MRLAAAVAVLLSATLSACFTGERPRIVEGAATTGDPAADAVLARLDGIGDAVFTADYELLTRYGDLHTAATVVQAEPGRRSITIGDVRFLLDGADAATCTLDSGGCSTTIDAGMTSNTQLGPDFYASSAAARLRRDAELRGGPTTASSEMIAGQPATCVTIPVAGASTTYCRARQRPAGPARRRRRGRHDDRVRPDAATTSRFAAGSDRPRGCQTDTSEWSEALSASGPIGVATTMSSRRMPQRPPT